MQEWQPKLNDPLQWEKLIEKAENWKLGLEIKAVRETQEFVKFGNNKVQAKS